ncbi:MAG TPA: hypothetical protein VIH03_06730 [Nitrososphaerales archaeon]
MEAAAKKPAKDLGTIWFMRFTYASLINAVIAIVWTSPVLISSLNIARQVAGGSAGTWGYVGYSLFLTTGFAATFIFGAMYYLIPKAMNVELFSSKLAALHLLLQEIGILGSTGLLSWAGFIGGNLLLGKKAEEVHGAIAQYVEPIGYFVATAMVGVIFGLINIIGTIRKKTESAREEPI